MPNVVDSAATANQRTAEHYTHSLETLDLRKLIRLINLRTTRRDGAELAAIRPQQDLADKGAIWLSGGIGFDDRGCGSPAR
jgi:hypothetical protein